MTVLSDGEMKARLSALRRGPWASSVAKSRQELGPVDSIPFLPGRTRSIALDRHVQSRANKRKSIRLERVLRPHFEYETAVDDEMEMKTRNTLDQALALPQLYELAVQSGYLPESSVRRPARSILKDLLWSAPARRFASAYDYIAVPMLAARVGISGFRLNRIPAAVCISQDSLRTYVAFILTNI